MFFREVFFLAQDSYYDIDQYMHMFTAWDCGVCSRVGSHHPRRQARPPRLPRPQGEEETESVAGTSYQMKVIQ